MRLPERSLRGIDVRIGPERLIHETVQNRRPEKRPPSPRHVRVLQETLGVARDGIGRNGLRRKWRGGVARDGGGGGGEKKPPPRGTPPTPRPPRKPKRNF